MKYKKPLETIPCVYCDQRFTSIDALFKHVDLTHDEPPKNRKPNLDETENALGPEPPKKWQK